jgi:hypothetical protein
MPSLPKFECRKCGKKKTAGLSDGYKFLADPGYHITCKCGQYMHVLDPDGKWKQKEIEERRKAGQVLEPEPVPVQVLEPEPEPQPQPVAEPEPEPVGDGAFSREAAAAGAGEPEPEPQPEIREPEPAGPQLVALDAEPEPKLEQACGQIHVGPKCDGAPQSTLRITFDQPFDSAPLVFCTVRGEDYPDVFCATVKSVTRTGCGVNVARVDQREGWGASTTALDWYAVAPASERRACGQVIVGQNSQDQRKEMVSVRIRFGCAFSAPPKVFVTTCGEQDLSDTFATSLYSVSATESVVHIQRVDSPGSFLSEAKTDWGQVLKLNWYAVPADGAVDCGSVPVTARQGAHLDSICIPFGRAFANPRVFLSVRGTGGVFDDVFALSLRSVKATECCVNLQRVDQDTAWGQPLEIDWHAVVSPAASLPLPTARGSPPAGLAPLRG